MIEKKKPIARPVPSVVSFGSPVPSTLISTSLLMILTPYGPSVFLPGPSSTVASNSSPADEEAV